MTILRYALGLTAAVVLGGVAAAQPAQPVDHPDTSMSPPPAASTPDPSMPAPTDTTTTAAPPAAPAATTAGADVAATAGTQVIASAPVPDTPENRAKYGGPMSHAGKHTQAKGN